MTRAICVVGVNLAVALATLAIPEAAAPPAAGAQTPGSACTTYTRGGISDALEWSSFERIVEDSAVIIDATVATVTPSSANRTPAPFPPDTDVTLRVSRVLKGQGPGSSVVVPQRAEVNTFDM